MPVLGLHLNNTVLNALVRANFFRHQVAELRPGSTCEQLVHFYG